ncbi:MAG: response regulator [Candidatus Omnitrophica bacterium]|nr:response regulator [Candidatus Omnitrophota bacterium]MBU1996891.1 response regulator [Candidatus Omnitrophota bacterium]
MNNQPITSVLVVDDDNIIRSSLRNYLEDNEYAVFEASSGADGLKVLEKERVDLVLVDLRMVGMDGLEVLAFVKEKYPKLPIIVLSGAGVISDVIKALRLGAWNYLLKPIEDLSVLKHALDNALEKVSLIEQNRKYQENLEKLVKERTAALEHELAARIKTEKQLFLRTQELESYSYVISHDLKEPLRNIGAFAHFLNEDYSKCLDEKGLEYLYHITSSIKRMSNLVDDLLHLSRIGKRFTEFALVDLNEIIEHAKLELYELIRTNDVVFEIGEMPQIVCQRTWMIEIFKNLIGNGIKYNENAKRIIKINCIESSKDYAFFVEDNGIGIAEKFHEKIFELFRRLHSRDKYDGTGAGLAVVKTIITQHGGSINVERSSFDRGTTMKFIIPKLILKSINEGEEGET